MPDRTSPYYTYITFVLNSLGWSASKLAKTAGVSPTTLTRFLFKDEYKFTPSSTTIEKIAKASGISPAPFLTATDYRDASMVPYTSKNLYDKSWNLDTEDDIRCTIVIGEANARFARVAYLEEFEKFSPLLIRIAEQPSDHCFAVKVQGGNINKIVQDGEHLVCLRFSAHTLQLFDGDIAIIERWMADDKRFIQLSARVMRRDGDLWLFEHASTDAIFDGDRLEASDLANPAGFRILGFAMFVYRDFRQMMH